MKTILFVFLGIVLSYVLALFWWRIWMYNGFVAPPEFLLPFIKGDGEDAYNRVELEMFITILIPVLVGIFCYRFKGHLVAR